MSCWCMGKYRGGNRGGTAASGGRERRPCRSRVVREARTDSLHWSGVACRDRYESGVKKGRDREGRGFSGNVDLLGVVGKARYAKRGSLWRRRKRTRYSVYPKLWRSSSWSRCMVSLGPMSAARGHCSAPRRAQTCAWRSQLSVFSLESRGGVGATGKGVPIRIASLRSGCSRGWEVLTIKRGKGEARCRPMGRVAEGRIERAERDDEEASKERKGFSKQSAGMSVGIEPTS